VFDGESENKGNKPAKNNSKSNKKVTKTKKAVPVKKLKPHKNMPADFPELNIPGMFEDPIQCLDIVEKDILYNNRNV
jgi:hypothetical protein